MIVFAARVAINSDHSLHAHAAMVLKKGKVIGFASNFGWKHAETRAIRGVSPRLLKGSIVWSIRIAKGGRIRMAKPCTNCEEALRRAGIKTVHYSTNDGNIISMDLQTT
jgi:pyrimidine deaminase RibD-like protein